LSTFCIILDRRFDARWFMRTPEHDLQKWGPVFGKDRALLQVATAKLPGVAEAIRKSYRDDNLS